MTHVLLVANDGGHLQQMRNLAPRLPVSITRRTWVTVESAQSRSLLAEEDVVHLEPSRPRDLAIAARNARAAHRLLRARRPDLVVSTGSSLGLAVLPVAASLRIPAVYVESATRVEGPSMTGRVLERVPGVRTYTQQQHWDRRGWRYAGSIFDAYAPGPDRSDVSVRRVVVTVGTSESYGFRRLLEALVPLVPPDTEVLWQTGSTDVTGLDVEARATVPATELRAAVEAADAVISHAGTGSSVVALDAGKHPLLVPRVVSHGEHIDDHQAQIARDLQRRGLVDVVDAAALTWEHVTRSARQRVIAVSAPPLVW